MAEPQRILLDKAKLNQGLAALDAAMGQEPMIYAFSPITMISPGGYPAVAYFQNRSSTEDVDVIIDPEHAVDKDVATAIRNTMKQVGEDLLFGRKWINEDVSMFLTPQARQSLFQDATKQNIVLWDGPHLRVLAAPLEWGLETKLRRLSTTPNHPKVVSDMNDIVVILKFLIDRNGAPLKQNTIQSLNRNGFDVAIKDDVIKKAAAEYQAQYGTQPFC
ncbi:uncharacterized protein CIMG_12534 [Coccidioides immitis RS]|uniref:DUF7582 domain-containing protein n=2 Tax=Coccidioides immitis TaxID=5501 RepID=A0A0D8JVE8_COCIM|nr:uncharacterized protein CIMG_12534 [Coccidioides immitis RS]KJF61277.1 hypothetical protein CIMG_12534 [Coccidioides immitis RS]KMU90907.1 hypothetical protein CIHG_08563 [Coccidioides immitis H538.4]